MDTVTLLYNSPALPALTDRNAESGLGNWASHGNHTVTQSNTHAFAGTYSFQVHSTGNGDASTNYVNIPSADNTVFTVGQKYCVTFQLYGAASGFSFSMVNGGVTKTFVDSYAGWHGFEFVFIATGTSSDLQFFNIFAGDRWIDAITVHQATQLNILAMKGLDDPDSYEFFPAIRNDYLDGSIDTQFQSFRRISTIDCGVVGTRSDRLGILYWWLDNSRMINYVSSSTAEFQLPFAPRDSNGYSNTWEQNSKLGRRFVLNISEPSTRTTFPV